MFFGDKATLKEVHDHIALLSDAKDFLGVNKERKLLVLKWLNVFGYAERKFLIQLANIDNSGGYRFIANLAKHNYIQPFKNEYYGKEVFMLGKRGLGELITEQWLDYDAKLPNKKKFIRSSRLPHDIGLQYVVLDTLLSQKTDTQLIGIDKDLRCNNLMIDAILTVGTANEDKVAKGRYAIEYEKTEKSRKRIEYLLVEHIENMKKGKYITTTFYFNDMTMCQYYLKILIDQPRVWHKNKEGKLIQFGNEKYAISADIAKKLYFKCVDVANPGNKLFSSSLFKVMDEREPSMQSYVQGKRDAIKATKAKKQEVIEQIEDRLREKLIAELTPQIEKEVEQRLRAEFESQYSKPKGFFGKILGE